MHPLLLRALPALSALLLVGAGCSAVQGSAMPVGPVRYARHAGPVRLSTLGAPSGAALVGTVEAQGMGTVQELVPEFVSRVQEVGGDHGVIDRWEVRFVWQQRPHTQTYNCGGGRAPIMCTRTYYIQEEVAVLHLEGRAFRTPEAR